MGLMIKTILALPLVMALTLLLAVTVFAEGPTTPVAERGALT